MTKAKDEPARPLDIPALPSRGKATVGLRWDQDRHAWIEIDGQVVAKTTLDLQPHRLEIMARSGRAAVDIE